MKSDKMLSFELQCNYYKDNKQLIDTNLSLIDVSRKIVRRYLLKRYALTGDTNILSIANDTTNNMTNIEDYTQVFLVSILQQEKIDIGQALKELSSYIDSQRHRKRTKVGDTTRPHLKFVDIDEAKHREAREEEHIVLFIEDVARCCEHQDKALAILVLLHLGYSNTEIIEIMGVGRTAYYLYKREIKEAIIDNDLTDVEIIS